MLENLKITNKVKINEFKKVSKIIFEESVFSKEPGLRHRFHYNEINQNDFLFLYSGKTLIGYIEFGRSPEYFKEFGIKFLGILPEYRGHKLGKLLLNKVISDFLELAHKIYLSIPSHATFLQKYYDELGFKPYVTLYATKFEDDFFGWFDDPAIDVLSKDKKVISKIPKLIMRLKKE